MKTYTYYCIVIYKIRIIHAEYINATLCVAEIYLNNASSENKNSKSLLPLKYCTISKKKESHGAIRMRKEVHFIPSTNEHYPLLLV